MGNIRLARPADAAEIRAIYAPIVRDTAISFEYEVPSVAEIERRLARVLAGRPWLVHVEAGRVLGYAYASPFRERAAYDWSVEVSIYVDSSVQRSGIGRRLYATLFDVLRALGYHQVIAGATMPNPASERLHRSLGFAQVAHFPAIGYKFGCWHDTVFWALPLRPTAGEAPAIININQLVKTAEWEWLTRD
ncbi:MAG TPA: GNAT family N-acetyltransferase [Burkholderiales bacterium]|nr:GNAT family N-acetyltransferase [Burkholderiales bacterium]